MRVVPLSARWSAKTVATRVLTSTGNGACVQTDALAYHTLLLNNRKLSSLHPDLSISSSNRRKRAVVAKFVELVPRSIRRNQECNVVDHNITQSHRQRFNMCRFSQSRHACSITPPLKRCGVAWLACMRCTSIMTSFRGSRHYEHFGVVWQLRFGVEGSFSWWLLLS